MNAGNENDPGTTTRLIIPSTGCPTLADLYDDAVSAGVDPFQVLISSYAVSLPA